MCSSSALAAALLAALAAVGCGRSDSAAQAEVWGRCFVERYAQDGITLLRHEGAAERIDLTLVRDVGRDAAQKMILEKIALFESAFLPGKPGYAGQHTRHVEYPERFEPQRFDRELEGGHLTYFSSFATANFVHGASSEDLAVHRSLYGLLHCPERELLVEIDYFAPLDDPAAVPRFAAGIRCDFE